MPIYEYRCPKGHTFERFQSMTAPAPEVCDVCGASPVEIVLYPVAVHYKGSGFYSTDYGKKGKAAAKKDGGEGGSSSGDSGSSSSGDSSSSSSGDSSSKSDSSPAKGDSSSSSTKTEKKSSSE
jgi:putative FmdB family regulatory protein